MCRRLIPVDNMSRSSVEAMSLPTPRRSALLTIFALQIVLLTIGLTRDYRLKHEDNNALHATFARSHIDGGFERTRGQNYFSSASAHDGHFYAHHPAGPSWALAAVYAITGQDGPTVTRTVAVFFHVLATWLFYGLARHVLRTDWEVLLATLVFVALPISAFFGRMMNHEVMVLPATLLLVRGYWECVRGGWTSARWGAAVCGGCLWAAVSGWAGFFAIGACALHAGWETAYRHTRRAPTVLVVLLVAGSVLGVLNAAHLVWALDGDVSYLRELLASRTAAESSYGAARWLARIMELHWRYFGVTSAVALIALAYRAVTGLGAGEPRDMAVEVGSIFLVGGIGYVVIFNVSATQHDYWQFMLLPASALGLVLVFRWLVTMMRQAQRRRVWLALLICVSFEITATASLTLAQRHTSSEAYCLETVAQLRRDWL